MSKIIANGNTYYTNDKNFYHREDGPAVEFANGTKYWYQNGKRHREDGPAIEYANGDEIWYIINGNFHRLDGPAMKDISHNYNEWWIKGKKIDCRNQKEFEKLIELKIFW